jgi:hypothetical protein
VLLSERLADEGCWLKEVFDGIEGAFDDPEELA